MKDAFSDQGDVRVAWRKYLDSLSALRPDLFRYCRRLTGDIWDGEDLVQETLARVFSLMGKIDAQLEEPRAYMIRTATNLWIDRMRRAARERAVLELEAAAAPASAEPERDARPAAKALFQTLHPQERAAILLKEVFDLPLLEIAAMLKTSEGAVKSALSRARGRLAETRPAAGFDVPPPEIVEKFMAALRDKDAAAMQALCSADFTMELVGGAEGHSYEQNKSFFTHAHMVMPMLGFGANPWWKTVDFEGERLVLGFRTLNGVEGLNEVHRLDVADGRVTRIRCYCFAGDVVRAVAEELGLTPLDRPYRSPSLPEPPRWWRRLFSKR